MAYGKKPGALANAAVAIIRAEYERQGLNQTKLAERSGISQSQVSRIFLGVRTMDVDQLQGMCDALNLNFIDVLTEAEERSR